MLQIGFTARIVSHRVDVAGHRRLALLAHTMAFFLHDFEWHGISPYCALVTQGRYFGF